MERIYLNTSVFGGYFDVEFEFWTKILFDQIMSPLRKEIIAKNATKTLRHKKHKRQDFNKLEFRVI